MILATNVSFLLVAIISGAFKKWKNYYETMIYVSFCNLLYNVLCHDQQTWKYQPDFLLNHKTADLINTFVLLPSSTILYLHFFPMHKFKKVFYYLGWIAGFSSLEYLWFKFGRISYDEGWNFLWSIGFYFAMFFAIKVHNSNPQKALLFSLVSIAFLLINFKIQFY